MLFCLFCSFPLIILLYRRLESICYLFQKRCYNFLAVFFLEKEKANELYLFSDSKGLYYFSAILVLLAVIFSSVIHGLIKHKQLDVTKSEYWFHIGISYYLSLQLMIYACAKIFKVQFYLPEPNTLFTPMGNISKDLLFWSTMGSSYSYTVFSGFIELVPAFFFIIQTYKIIRCVYSFWSFVKCCNVKL